MEGIGLHVEDILVPLVLSIIISCTFKILAHKENQYSYLQNIRPIFCLTHPNRLEPGLGAFLVHIILPYFAGYSTHLYIVRRYQYLYQNTDSMHRWIVRTRVVSIYTVCMGCVLGISLLLKAFRMWFNSAGDIRI